MVFSSFTYLIFFCIVALFMAISKLRFLKDRFEEKSLRTFRHIILLIASYIFYGWWDWRFLGLLLITTLSTFFAGWLMGKTSDCKKRKLTLIGTIVLNIGILFLFKYFNFFVQAFSDAFLLFGRDLGVHSLKIILPVGISFYTFTALSYSIDVYHQKVIYRL